MIEKVVSMVSLQEKLDEVKRVTTKRQHLYYGLESIDNFIFHLNNLSERTRDRAATYIDDYLNIVSEKIKDENDLFGSARYLAPHKWKISQLYSLELGFVSKPNLPIQVAICAFLFFCF